MSYTINCGGRLLSTERPLVMGILNVTPDSFFDGGRYIDSQDAIRSRAEQILSEGADVIDLGAYSSRPGADDVSADEEWRRLSVAFDVLNKHFPDAVVSVDTFRADVARRCVKEGGAAIINDISAGVMDSRMFETVADLRVPYILMHMQGTPKDMQLAPHYDGRVTDCVISQLSAHVSRLTELGVSDVIIDPGFGFGKTIEDNYRMMADLRRFSVFRMPILVGISRKSMIYKLLGSAPSESLNGTTVLNVVALLGGADILRVHDVRECVEAVRMVEKLKECGLSGLLAQ